ncbi:two-component system, NarL family, sensor histidine kinase DesK [Streptomyces sp. cf386]|uniref:sensor histidine kinase n=1 Tax=Streptomyces sp. cf386 TaxID=1761904 RepID=UPI00087F431D|nr:histidine kinase [Streptomyces sp. cf386]SDP34622.1 two-component system, NarL family, sensor histidine kinase DesK [Streptomyces sp. cf386]
MGDGRIDHEAAGLSSFRRYTWWTVPGMTVCVLTVFVGAWVLDGDVPLWARGPAAVALAVEVWASAVLLSRRLTLLPVTDAHPAGPPPGLLLAAVGAGVVLAALPLAVRDYGLWPVAPALVVAIVATYLPPPRRRPLIAGAVVLALLPGGVVSLVEGDGELAYAALFPAGLVAFTAWVTLGPLWAWDTAWRLDEARRLEAELAVREERLRFAGDLHDIQGHHLQVIALKSELAARLVEVDPARAATELKEIRQLSADALSDTRAVVQGYRRTSLDAEIGNATRVLAAADIDARTTLEPAAVATELTDSARHLLGLVMREATTNVLRHSRARHAEVDYRIADGLARLRVSNDGAERHPAALEGTGLRTLAERLEAAGGELTWHHDGDLFLVAAALPAQPCPSPNPADGAAR